MNVGLEEIMSDTIRPTLGSKRNRPADDDTHASGWHTESDDDDRATSWDDKVASNDGAADFWGKRAKSPNVSAIFIHAGAGYHSIANEQIHLGACSE